MKWTFLIIDWSNLTFQCYLSYITSYIFQSPRDWWEIFCSDFFGIDWPWYLPNYIIWISSAHLRRSFRFYWNIVGCWIVFLHWSYQRFLTLNFFLVCVRELTVGRIQTGDTCFSLQDWGRLWQGYKLGDHNCSHQLTVLIEIKYPLGSSEKTSFVGCWLVFLHWLYQHFLILKLVLGCVRKISVDFIQAGHTDLIPHII